MREHLGLLRDVGEGFRLSTGSICLKTRPSVSFERAHDGSIMNRPPASYLPHS